MVTIVGHRGAAGHAPENTLLAFQTAIDIGCDRVELDVRTSKDGTVVVFHDEDVSRTTNGKGLVHELNLLELKKLHCPQGQRIPTLQEVIDLCKNNIDLQIELKAPGTPQLVSEILASNGCSALITSFESELLEEMKRVNPTFRLCLLLQEYSEEVWKLADTISCDVIGLKGERITKEVVQKARHIGKSLYAYHVNEKDMGERLIAWGIKEIGTDFPKLFLRS